LGNWLKRGGMKLHKLSPTSPSHLAGKPGMVYRIFEYGDSHWPKKEAGLF